MHRRGGRMGEMIHSCSPPQPIGYRTPSGTQPLPSPCFALSAGGGRLLDFWVGGPRRRVGTARHASVDATPRPRARSLTLSRPAICSTVTAGAWPKAQKSAFFLLPGWETARASLQPLRAHLSLQEHCRNRYPSVFSHWRWLDFFFLTVCLSPSTSVSLVIIDEFPPLR